MNRERTEWNAVWNAVCYQTGGGCQATVYGDSAEAAIAAWNRRTQVLKKVGKA